VAKNSLEFEAEMLEILSKVLMVLFLLATPFLIYGFGKETFEIITKISYKDSRWMAFGIGFIIFFPIHFIASNLFRTIWLYLQTLEHELTHLFIGLFFLKIPTGIRVTAHEGGEVRQIGRSSIGMNWIALAPYFFPTVSIFIVLIAFLTGIKTEYLLGLLGWSTAFHLITNWTETSFRQTDLQKVGIIKTLLILPVMNIICYGMVLAFVGNGGVLDFIFQSLQNSWNIIWQIPGQ
jgi:hypothetical protein